MQSTNKKILVYLGLIALVLVGIGMILALSSRSATPAPPPAHDTNTNPIMTLPSTVVSQIQPLPSTPFTPDTSYPPLVTQARSLTEAQRIHIEENTSYIGDEATFTVSDTADHLIYYVGMDDHFSVQLQSIFPTREHRTSAEREIAKVLNVPMGEVCQYDVRFTTTPNVAGSVPSDILTPCPQAR